MFNYRIYILTVTACLGSFLFGYDTGFIGGATTLTSFHHSFNITPSTSAQITGNVVAALQAGCFFGSILMAFFTDKLGRKKGLMVAAGVMAVGSVMQTVAEGRLGLFYAGRVVSGVGVGAASMLVPTYVGEMSPRGIRGRLLTLYGFFIFLGIAIAYWVDYACTSLLPSTSPNQWRIPVALQILPAAGLLLGILFCRESPRWLIRKGRTEEALENLIYIRYYDHHQESSSGGGDGDGGGDADAGAETETREEFLEICESVRMEAEVRHGVGVREMWARGNRRRVALGFGVMVCQQLSGTVTFTYYAPQFFTEVGISSSSTGLFATGIYGIVKTVATMLFLLFVIDRVGRRPSLICGAVGMAITMLVVACVLATHPVSQSQSGDGDGKGGVSSASYAMIVMIYLFCVSYACSWGPVPWTYVGEIYPNRIREYCIAMAASTQWAFNYCISKIVPIAIANIGWRVFLMFAIFNIAITIFTILFVKETKGVALEEMEGVFEGVGVDVEKKAEGKGEQVEDVYVEGGVGEVKIGEIEEKGKKGSPTS